MWLKSTRKNWSALEYEEEWGKRQAVLSPFFFYCSASVSANPSRQLG
jgi:hypothetical protein